MDTAPIIDFDLHGLAGVRLIDASPADVSAVLRQLGPMQRPLMREPDILIQFAERVTIDGPCRYIGGDEISFTDDAFLVQCGQWRARIDFAQIGKQCVIVSETGLPAVPLLRPILNMTVLGKGALPVHASAFTYNGTGILATGWAHGSKTGTLLAFMARGAEYIGDDWVYLSPDGRRMYGLPQMIQVREDYLQDLPQYATLIGRGRRTGLWAIKMLHALTSVFLKGRTGRSLPYRTLRRLNQFLDGRLCIHLSPHQLFGNERCPMAGSLEKVFLVVSGDAPEISVHPADPQDVAERLVFALQHEWQDFLSYYMKFRFAFPEARNELIERTGQLQSDLLGRILRGKETYVVYHPYPVRAPALFDAISRVIAHPAALRAPNIVKVVARDNGVERAGARAEENQSWEGPCSR
jgi:hypothetical protein